MPTTIAPAFPFDPTGVALSNLVPNEQQILTAANGVNQHLIVPNAGPYFDESLKITLKDLGNNVRTLVRGIDYVPTHLFISASRACVKPVYGSITIMDRTLAGIVTLQYQSVGGEWTLDSNAIAQVLADVLHNPVITAWEQVTNYPNTFPVINHQWHLNDMVGAKALQDELLLIEQTIRNRPIVTPAQLGVYTALEVDALITLITDRLSAEGQTRDVAYFLGQS